MDQTESMGCSILGSNSRVDDYLQHELLRISLSPNRGLVLGKLGGPLLWSEIRPARSEFLDREAAGALPMFSFCPHLTPRHPGPTFCCLPICPISIPANYAKGKQHAQICSVGCRFPKV